MGSSKRTRPGGSLWERLVNAFHGRDAQAPAAQTAVPWNSLEWRVDPET
ncbi:hypothetical protein [Streptomyces sp. LN699]